MKLFGNDNDKYENKIGLRAAFLYLVFIFLLFCTMMSLFSVSSKEVYGEAVNEQSTYKMSIGTSRGTIYDCNLSPITNSETYYVYSVIPSPESLKEISNFFSNKYLDQFEDGKPFTIESQTKFEFESDYIDTFECKKRYDNTACHIIGYLDYENNGISGIEKAYNSYLGAYGGESYVKYKVNALSSVISPSEREVQDKSDAFGGVVLTIDKSLQKFCENQASKHLKTGAIIVSDINSGKIKALVSYPFFSQNDVSSSLEEKNAPFVNRAFAPFIPGSVFKLATAAAALENDIYTEEKYICNGFEEIGSDKLFCYNQIPHGEICGLNNAISESCNCYFMDLSKRISPSEFLSTVYKLGFGFETKFADECFSAKGNIPDKDYLSNPSSFALVSFGQGTVCATPIQIAAFINTIANGGFKTEPYLVEGLVDENLVFTNIGKENHSYRILSQKTVDYLKKSMLETVENGTGSGGKPDYKKAGAKTGTAQTGTYYKNGDEFVNFWYAGFYPYENPEFSIVVLSDNVPESDTSPCDEIFKEVCNYLFLNLVK